MYSRKDMLMSMKSKNKAKDSGKIDGDLGHLKKVVVASDSSQGLEKGLDKAEDILKGRRSSPIAPPEKLAMEEELPEELDEMSEGMEEEVSPLEEKFEMLKDLEVDDMRSVIEFLEAMIAGKEAEEVPEELSEDLGPKFDDQHVF